jgi:hypothetical protein
VSNLETSHDLAVTGLLYFLKYSRASRRYDICSIVTDIIPKQFHSLEFFDCRHFLYVYAHIKDSSFSAINDAIFKSWIMVMVSDKSRKHRS